MKLRAEITIEVDAKDFVGAADHQRRIEALMQSVRREYQEARLEFRERKPRPPRNLPAARLIGPVRVPAALYEDD